MSWFIKVFFPFLFIFRVIGYFLIHVYVLILGEFAHDFFYAPFHHPEVLFGIYWLRLRFALNILYLFDGPVLTLLTFKTAVNACSRLRRFVENISKMDLDMVIGELLVHEGHILRGIIDGEIMPTIGAESWEVKTQWVV